LSHGFSKKEEKIFDVVDKEIQRGKVGIGTTKLKNVYFQAISVEDLNVPKIEEGRD
jgi:hypothetical protein